MILYKCMLNTRTATGQKVDSGTKDKVQAEKSSKDNCLQVETNKKIVLQEALGKLNTVRAKAVKMTESLIKLSHEELVNKVQESSAVRMLPANDMKAKLLDRLNALNVAAAAVNTKVAEYLLSG